MGRLWWSRAGSGCPWPPDAGRAASSPQLGGTRGARRSPASADGNLWGFYCGTAKEDTKAIAGPAPSLLSSTALLCARRGKMILGLEHSFSSFQFMFLFWKAIGLICLLGKGGTGGPRGRAGNARGHSAPIAVGLGGRHLVKPRLLHTTPSRIPPLGTSCRPATVGLAQRAGIPRGLRAPLQPPGPREARGLQAEGRKGLAVPGGRGCRCPSPLPGRSRRLLRPWKIPL